MGKVSNKYLEVDPYKIIEKGFHKDRNQVSESIFSLCNEYMGVRNSFEEGVSLHSLKGTYFNGIIEYAKKDIDGAYLGVVKRSHFTINSVDFYKVRIYIDNVLIDLAKLKCSNFVRTLDMRTGLVSRNYIVTLGKKHVEFSFERLLDMVDCPSAYQRIIIKTDSNIKVSITFYLDNEAIHWGNDTYWKDTVVGNKGDIIYLTSKTLTTHQSLAASSIVNTTYSGKIIKEEKQIGITYKFALKAMEVANFVRYVNILVNEESDKNISELLKNSIKNVTLLRKNNFDYYVKSNEKYFNKVWDKSDVEISGCDIDQQGIRYCIFQLETNYHGYAEDNNIGAKGLTGEAYSGHAFWDSETYCLPYYLFSNQKAALNLLMFRYNTLYEAKQRAKMLDCEGACYPIATRNGYEGCTLWQHASCQFQPTTAVGYAIYHYMNVYNDHNFMQKYGLEMLLEICKFLLSRGQYDKEGNFGYYGVMGPDEFQMMVNNNAYTNFMAKKMFNYLFTIIGSRKYKTEALYKKCGYTPSLIKKMKLASSKMIILYDKETKLFEQHDGFYKLPHVDIDKIPVTDFPLYSHWSYDRIYRNDIIKQPDVLMFMFLYPGDFTYEQIKANYEFYEPRCLHESSLSPSIHSILASYLGKEKEAMDFFGFATRLDLDDYNRNTLEGLHMTSIAAAWMNIVYGFLGLRSDTSDVSIAPKLPKRWKSYKVNLLLNGSKVGIFVDSNKIKFSLKGKPISLIVNGQKIDIVNELEVTR